ncbi:MAG: VRR-NUC domain-containing protein [Eubacteriales bacterium]|jgi:hypothetical protein
MTEKQIESYLRDEVKKAGGIAYKFVSPGNAGVPDRLVVMPGGKILFVELKAPTGKPTTLQELQMHRLAALGAEVFIIRGKEQIDELIELMKGGDGK